MIKNLKVAGCLGLIALALISPRVNAQITNTNAATIGGGKVRGFPGRMVPVPWSLRHTGLVSGVQFDLNYATNKLNSGSLSSATASSNVVVRSRQISPGTYRMLAYPKVLGVMGTNSSLGAVNFSALEGNLSTGGRIGITNAVVSRTNAIALLPIGLLPGHVLTGPVFRGDDGIVELFLTVQSNRTYVVQATTNLVDWVNISTNLALADYIISTDLEALVYPLRFYRVVPLEAISGGQITGARIQSGNLFTFAYPTLPGRSYVLQSSTNLASWITIGTNVSSSNGLAFTNFVVPEIPQRFFRLFEVE